MLFVFGTRCGFHINQVSNCCICQLDVCSSASNFSPFGSMCSTFSSAWWCTIYSDYCKITPCLSHYHTGIFQGAWDDRADHKASKYLETRYIVLNTYLQDLLNFILYTSLHSHKWPHHPVDNNMQFYLCLTLSPELSWRRRLSSVNSGFSENRCRQNFGGSPLSTISPDHFFFFCCFLFFKIFNFKIFRVFFLILIKMGPYGAKCKNKKQQVFIRSELNFIMIN